MSGQRQLSQGVWQLQLDRRQYFYFFLYQKRFFSYTIFSLWFFLPLLLQVPPISPCIWFHNLSFRILKNKNKVTNKKINKLENGKTKRNPKLETMIYTQNTYKVEKLPWLNIIRQRTSQNVVEFVFSWPYITGHRSLKSVYFPSETSLKKTKFPFASG